MSEKPALAVAFAALTFVLAPGSLAQELLFEHRGATLSEGQRAAVGLPDLDSDGVIEFAIGGPGEDGGGTDAGAIHILSGKTYSELAVLYGENPGDQLRMLARAPDIDADGVDDFLAQAFYTDYAGTDTGSAYVYSGRTLTLLKRLEGNRDVPFFGYRGGGLGDLDGDGRGDFFLTDPFDAGNLGRVVVYSSATFTPLYTLAGSDPDSAFGFVASPAGDVDQDGALDFMVGDFHADSIGGTEWVGMVFVYSGRTGSLLRTYTGAEEYDELGEECINPGDVNLDGIDDHLLLSRHGGDGAGGLADLPAAYLHSGKDGVLLRRFALPSNSPFFQSWYSAGATGDVTGDGVPDFVLGALYIPAKTLLPATLLYSGRTLEHVHTLLRRGPDLHTFEPRYALLGDLDGDGLADLSLTNATTDGANLARIHAGNPLWLKLNFFDAAAGDTIELTVSEGAPGAPVLIALDEIDGVPTLLALGGLGVFDANGVRFLAETVPGGLSGRVFVLQAFSVTGASGLVATGRERLRFK